MVRHIDQIEMLQRRAIRFLCKGQGRVTTERDTWFGVVARQKKECKSQTLVEDIIVK